MPAKLTLHPPQRASRFIVIRDGETLTIGRDPDCGLVIEDPRVSKRHARIGWTGFGWVLEDLDSKNGTSLNGMPAAGRPLADDDSLSLGGLLGRFETLTEVELQGLQADRLARLDTSLELRRRLAAQREPLDLMLGFLQSSLEVTGTERGFVLVSGPDGRLRAEVATGFAERDPTSQDFSGSVGAVERVLETGASLVVSDAQSDPFLGGHPSVVGMGLGALACVPLVQDGRIFGLLYVDSRKPRAAFSELDLEILESLAEHTAIVLASLKLDQRVRKLFQEPSGAGLAGSRRFLAELQQKIDHLAALGTRGPSAGSGQPSSP